MSMGLQQLVKVLEPFDIQTKDIEYWEAELGMRNSLPQDASPSRYEDYHVSLFKNIKKHLMLGRTLAEIRKLMVLPSQSSSTQAAIKPPEQINDTQFVSEQQTVATVRMPRESYKAKARSQSQPHYEMSQASQRPNSVNTPSDILMQEAAHAFSLEKELEKMDYSMQLARNVSQELLIPPEQLVHLSAKSKAVPKSQQEVDQALGALKNTIEKNESQSSQAIKPVIESQLEKLTQRQASVEETLRQNISASSDVALQQTGLMVLIDRLVNDKDDLNSQLTEVSLYSTHLRKVNLLYESQLKENEQRIQELREQLHQLQNQLVVSEQIQSLDNKAKLQQKLIQLEADNDELESELSKVDRENQALKKQLQGQNNPKVFLGTWLEEATLLKVDYDTMGINIPPKRSRTFKLAHPPEKCYGSMAILETTYDYRTNTLWKRQETLIVQYNAHQNQLMGELTLDYLLEGKSVAKATYQVICNKQI